MTTPMLTFSSELNSPEPQYAIGCHVARSGTKATQVAIVIAAIGLQAQTLPSKALTESGSHFQLAGDAMPTGKPACRSKFAKVALTPKQLKATALEIRREWMTELGMDEAEIQVHCGPNTMADLDEEMEQRTAMKQLQQLNALL